MSKTYLSDIIKDEYKQWKIGDYIIFDSDTGTGKTTMLVKLIEEAKKYKRKILYLVSRTNKVSQLRFELSLIDSQALKYVYIICYQGLEEAIITNSNSFKDYEKCYYIFCDECHYFIDDIQMETNTGFLSYDWVRKQNNTVRIFASATAYDIFKVLKNTVQKENLKIYSIEKDYSYIKGIYPYKDSVESMIELIKNLLEMGEEEKILIFVKDIYTIECIYNHFGYYEADYMCSKYGRDKRLRKICNLISGDDNVVINKRILVSTKVLDCGVNIVDEKLRYIICDIPYPNTFIQCIGRKRSTGENDTLYVFFRNVTMKHFNSLERSYLAELEKTKEFLNNPDEFYRKHSKDPNLNKGISCLVFNLSMTTNKDKPYINMLKKYSYMLFIQFCEKVREIGYIEALKTYMHEKLADKITLDLPFLFNEGFIDLLTKMANQERRFYKADHEQLIDLFKVNMDLNRVTYIHKTFGLKIMNDWLSNRYPGIDMSIKSRVDKVRTIDGLPNPNRDKNYWIVELKSLVS